MLRSFTFAFVFCLICSSQLYGQSWKNNLGLTQLLNEVNNLEDGTGITVAQIEAPTNQNGNAYLPNFGAGEFSGVNFTDASGFGITSSHGTNVGTRLFGNSGVAPGVTDVDCFEVNDYLGAKLNFGGGDPFTTVYDVQNHSYVASGLAASDAFQLSARADWHINQTNTLMCVGATNNSGQATPQLMAHCYNNITVGRRSGNHSHGLTTFYGAGRLKPEIVNWDGPTSIATPTVAGCAAILKQAAAGTNATESVVLKALLLAGAEKGPVSNWSRTPTSPIDGVFGAGQANILNSYYMLQAGEVDGNANPGNAAAGLMGWDYGTTIDPNGAIYYDFSFPTGGKDVSILLTWNVNVFDTNAGALFVPDFSLANFDMEFIDEDGNVVDMSISSVDNLEHIYFPALAPGNYQLKITSDTDQDFGIAWRAEELEEISADSFEVAQGILQGGGIADLNASDNQDVSSVRSAQSLQARITLQFKSVSPKANPDVIAFTTEGAVFSRRNISQSVDFYNYETATWEEVKVGGTTRFADSVSTANASGDLSRFVEPDTMCIEARIRFQATAPRTNFASNLDHVFWTVD